MDKVLATTLMIAFFLIGSIVGIVMFPQVVTEVKTEYINSTTEVEVPVEVEVEVEKNFETYKTEAVELCLAEFVDDKDLDEYQDIFVLDVSDDWKLKFYVSSDDNDVVETRVNSIKFRGIDTLTEQRQTWTRNCKVVDEAGEKLEITV